MKLPMLRNHFIRVLGLMLVAFLSACQGTPSELLEPQGGAWRSVGGAVNSNPSFATAMVLGRDDRPIVTYTEFDTSVNFSRIFVKRWNGTTWVQLGGALNDNEPGNHSGNIASIALNTSGQPVVAWCDYRPAERYYYLTLKVWNGRAWQPFAGEPFLVPNTRYEGNCSSPSLVIGSDNKPTVALLSFINNSRDGSYIVRVYKWNGVEWIYYSPDINQFYTASFSLALDRNNNPVVALTQEARTGGVSVERWNGSSWERYGSEFSLNFSLNQRANDVSLALDSNDYPVIAWQEVIVRSTTSPNKSNIYVKRWNGSSWSFVGNVVDETLENNARLPKLAIRSDGVLAVGYLEALNSSETGKVFTRRFFGGQWNTYAETPVANAASRLNELSLRSDNRPVVNYTINNNILISRF